MDLARCTTTGGKGLLRCHEGDVYKLMRGCGTDLDPCNANCDTCPVLSIDGYSGTMFDVCDDELCPNPPLGPPGLDNLCAGGDPYVAWDGKFGCVPNGWTLPDGFRCTNGMRLSTASGVIKKSGTECDYELWIYVYCEDGTDLLLWKGTSTAGIEGPYTREAGCSTIPTTINMTCGA